MLLLPLCHAAVYLCWHRLMLCCMAHTVWGPCRRARWTPQGVERPLASLHYAFPAQKRCGYALLCKQGIQHPYFALCAAPVPPTTHLTAPAVQPKLLEPVPAGIIWCTGERSRCTEQLFWVVSPSSKAGAQSGACQHANGGRVHGNSRMQSFMNNP